MPVKNRLREIRMQNYLMNQKQFSTEVLDMDYRKYNHYEKGTVPSGETLLFFIFLNIILKIFILYSIKRYLCLIFLILEIKRI